MKWVSVEALCGNCRGELFISVITDGLAVRCPHCGFPQWFNIVDGVAINRPGVAPTPRPEPATDGG